MSTTRPHMARQRISRLLPVINSYRTYSHRTYHSYTHPAPPGPFNAVEESILGAAYKHIPASGFTNTTLSLGAKDAGYLDVSTNLFPKGAYSLVQYHLVKKREGLKMHTDIIDGLRPDGRPLGVGQKVKALTWERLLENEEIIQRYQEALSLITLPSNISSSLQELHALSDEIWFLANDTSVDTSWYTKRLTLSAIYSSSELFMTTDKSEGFRDTREFLDRRFEDNMEVGKVVGGLGQWVGFTLSAAVDVARSKGVRI